MPFRDYNRKETYKEGQDEGHRHLATSQVCTDDTHKVGAWSPAEEGTATMCASITVWAGFGYISKHLMSTIGNSQGIRLVGAVIFMLYPIALPALGSSPLFTDRKDRSVNLCNCQIREAP